LINHFGFVVGGHGVFRFKVERVQALAMGKPKLKDAVC
jgi:hypothetical protein